MTWDRKAPFSADGSLLNYVSPSDRGAQWRDADTPVELTLTFQEFQRGRSAANAIWKDVQGRQYSMFLIDLQALILTGVPTKSVTGKWVFAKRGQDYGIKLFQPK